MSQAGLLDIEGSNPQIPTSFVTDDGIAVPIANVLELLGQVVPAVSIPFRSTGSGNTVIYEVQYASAVAATDPTAVGLASFDSADFTVDANGFVSLTGGGGTGIQSITVDEFTPPGTNPVLPTLGGTITVTGAAVANHSVVLETHSRAANTYNIEVQYATTSPGSDATKSGVAHFYDGQFTVDANGFVEFIGGGGGGGGGAKFTRITASGSWTKDVNAVYIKVFGWAGGGGGGSGRRGAADTDRGGGGGGAGGGAFYFEGPADFFGSSETVVIGAGGAGGAAITTDDTDGNNGSSGGETSFGNLTTYTQAGLFSGGQGGTTFGGSGGLSGYVFQQFSFEDGNIGGSPGGVGAGTSGQDLNSIGNLTSEAAQAFVNSTGGGGGGINSSNIAANGGSGGNIVTMNAAANIILAGGTAGTVGVGQAGGAGNNPSITNGGLITVATAGGGGASNLSGASGAGGAGGIPGGAGGGGAASVNGNNSGAGGDGGRGEVWVVEFLEGTTATNLTYTPVNSSPYVVLQSDDFLGVDTSGGPITIQLLNAPTGIKTLTIKDISGSAATNNITVTTAGGVVLIDGATSRSMILNYESLNFLFNGTSYQVW